MPIKAVLFDLDDTLIVDEAVSKEAMKDTANLAAKLHGADSSVFLVDAIRFGSTLWKSGPCHSYCQQIGISFHECLWGEFLGDKSELIALRTWAQNYRCAVFDAILRKQGIADLDASNDLAQAFASSRRRLQRLMPDAKETLARLKGSYKLALLTNGAPDLQQEKIAASGLGAFFDAIAVSGEHGIGKPRSEIFDLLLAKLAVDPSEAAMVGNSMERDILGAKNAGLAAAIWLRVPGSEEQADVVPDYTITGLHEIAAILQKL